MKMTIELSKTEVEKAVKFYLEHIEDFKVKTVDLKVGNVSEGYGPMETTRPGFQCARCEVEKQ